MNILFFLIKKIIKRGWKDFLSEYFIRIREGNKKKVRIEVVLKVEPCTEFEFDFFIFLISFILKKLFTADHQLLFS